MTTRNRINEMRTKKGLSQKEFAKAFSDFIKNDENVKSVSYATISRWERGENEPKIETWNKLSDYFHIPVSYLRGSGWSQNDVIWFLMYVYVNRNNDDFELPSGIHCDCGDVEKYGIEKETFEDFDADDIPGVEEKIKEFLLYDKSDDITRDICKDYYNGDNVLVDRDEIKDYIDEHYYDLADKYVSLDDLESIKEEVVSGLDNKSIDLPSVLDKLISESILKLLDPIFIEYTIEQDKHKISSFTIDTMKSIVDKELFNKFKIEVTNKIKSINDYVFLSNIGEDFNNTGISPEYEIAKKVADDLEFKQFQNRQDYFSENPYKASSAAINNLSFSANDKSNLLDIVDYLISENEKANEKIEELERRLNLMEHPEWDRDYDD